MNVIQVDVVEVASSQKTECCTH